jgi:hypothetical protein
LPVPQPIRCNFRQSWLSFATVFLELARISRLDAGQAACTEDGFATAFEEAVVPIPGGYRRHSLQFKLQVCSDIRSGKLGRREAQRAWRLSPKLLQVWLGRYDRGELGLSATAAVSCGEPPAAA